MEKIYIIGHSKHDTNYFFIFFIDLKLTILYKNKKRINPSNNFRNRRPIKTEYAIKEYIF